MTDIFISYAHEDQDFVRRMVPALEAEGFSVWWDHTIPPGKSWDTFIARGIEEAKVCIVVWSAHSVASKWVLEEATLAGDAEKLLPVQIGGGAPPIGFRRMQAAQLNGWSGDRANPQWQLLMREAHSLVTGGGGQAAPPPRAPRPGPAPVDSPKRKFLLPALGLAAVAVGAVVAFGVLREQPTPAAVEAPAEAAVEDALDAVDSAPSLAPAQQAEIERLRRENEQLVNQRTAAEQAQREAEQRATAPGVTSLECASAAGSIPSFSGPGNPNSSGTYLFDRNGVVGAGQGTRWSQNGASATFSDNRQYTYRGTISGNRFSGTVTNASGSSMGTFDLEIGEVRSPCP